MWKHLHYSSVCVPPIPQHLRTFVFSLLIHNPEWWWTHLCFGWGWTKAQSDLVTNIQEIRESAHWLEPQISDPGCGHMVCHGQSQADVARTLSVLCQSQLSCLDPVRSRKAANVHTPTHKGHWHTYFPYDLFIRKSKPSSLQLFTSLLIKNNPKKQLQAQAWEYISSYLKHYFIPGWWQAVFSFKDLLKSHFRFISPKSKIKKSV